MHYATGNQIGIVLDDIRPVATSKPQVPVGTIVQGIDSDFPNAGCEYIYALNVPAVVRGSCVYLDTYNGCVLADSAVHANDGGPVAWALNAMAAQSYGWFQISGAVVAKCAAAGVAANSKVFLTAIPGEVDDVAIAGCQINGAEFEAASGVIGAGLVSLTCTRPHVQSQIT